MFTLLKTARARVREFFNSRHSDLDLEQELASHLSMLVEENARRGMAPEEARRQALIRLGTLDSNKELHREARGLPALDVLLCDLRYTFRVLRRSASFFAFAILILALGIGVCSTMFCVVNSLLFQLPFPDSGRLVWVWNSAGRDGQPARQMPVGHFLGLRDHNQTLSGLAGYYGSYQTGSISLTGSSETLRLTGVPVTQNFFFRAWGPTHCCPN